VTFPAPLITASILLASTLKGEEQTILEITSGGYIIVKLLPSQGKILRIEPMR
jgi:redox-regulated HSP33 family molecular chaperone